jgi:hypothetical protein
MGFWPKEDGKGIGAQMSREPLFSVHGDGEGAFTLYLEEQDANLDLLEDVVEQVSIVDLAGLKEFGSAQALKHDNGAVRLDAVRSGFGPVVTKIAKMSEAEALTLSQMIVESVKQTRILQNKPKLELVK